MKESGGTKRDGTQCTVHHSPDCGKPKESVKGNTGRLLLFGRTRTLVWWVVSDHLVALAVHVVVREVTDKHPSFRLKGYCHELIKGGFFGFFSFFMSDIQHCFICRPSDSTVPQDAEIEPRTVAIATSALAVRRSNYSARSQPQITSWIFFEGPKIKTLLFEWALMVSEFLAVFFCSKSKIKFLSASIKAFTNCKNPSSNPLQRACFGFLIAAGVSKSCSESRLWPWKLYTGKNRPLNAKEVWNRNLMRLPNNF